MESSSLSRDWPQALCTGSTVLATGPPGKSPKKYLLWFVFMRNTRMWLYSQETLRVDLSNLFSVVSYLPSAESWFEPSVRVSPSGLCVQLPRLCHDTASHQYRNQGWNLSSYLLPLFLSIFPNPSPGTGYLHIHVERMNKWMNEWIEAKYTLMDLVPPHTLPYTLVKIKAVQLYEGQWY